ILTTRAAYESVGTHQAVKESVVDDMALAQTYVRHHLDIFLTHGEQYMVTRMYTSLAGIAEGWTKNLATGVPLAFPPIPLVRRLAPHVMWLPALLWIVPPLAWARFGWWAAAATSHRSGPRRRDRDNPHPAPRTSPDDRSQPQDRRTPRWRSTTSDTQRVA